MSTGTHTATVAARRLAALGIDPAPGGGAAAIEQLVSDRLALQAQDLASGLWSVGLRTGASAVEIHQAIRDRAITRSWPMRGTLHLMATRDVRWMCLLLAPRSMRQARSRLAQLELTDAVIDRARDLLGAALADGRALTRVEAFAVLRAGGVPPDGQRGIHLLGRFCQEGLLCQGPLAGPHPTFVLLEDWVPFSWLPDRAEAMATVARRYVAGHGPVTLKDLAGWTGETLAFAREAVALAGDCLVVESIDGVPHLVHVDAPAPAARPGTYLLPGFDEFLLGYKDRSSMLTREEELRVVPGRNGVFLPTVVVGGVVVGTWTRSTSAARVDVTVQPWGSVSSSRRRAIEAAAAGYGRFLGVPARVSWSDPATP
ncbi:MAG: winged helix DNA-binding domain-containing protein [Lapillicoccus sp.]